MGHGPTMAATARPTMAAMAHPRHGRHSTGTLAMGTATTAGVPDTPPFHAAMAATTMHTAAPMLALLPHGRYSTPPPWAPQHAPTMGATAHPLRNACMAMAGSRPNMPLGDMACHGAVAGPLGPAAGGGHMHWEGVFAFFLHFAGCS